MNRREMVLRTALAALALGGVAAAIWAALAVRSDVAASAPSRASDCRAPEAAASYPVTFVSTWSAQTHPESFPADAHYSDLHAATHHAGWSPDCSQKISRTSERVAPRLAELFLA